MKLYVVIAGRRRLVAEHLELEQVLCGRTRRQQYGRAAAYDRGDEGRGASHLTTAENRALEADLECHANGTRNRGMEVKVFHRRRLIPQTRFEEVVDIGHFGVEDVEPFEQQADAR